MSALLDGSIQVHFLLRSLRLLQTPLKRIQLIGLGICVHDAHVESTVSTILPEVMYQEVTLLFCGFWCWRIVQDGCACGPVQLCLRPLQGATCEDEGIVAHVSGGGFFSGQVCDPVMELVMTCCDEATPLKI